MTNFIGAEVGSEKILDVLGKFVELSADTGPAMKSIAGFMENQVRLGFKVSQSPYGDPWAPIEHREGQPLIDTRTLLGSISSSYGVDFAEVGTNLVYAPIQNFGGSAGKNKTSKIAARPYLPIQGDEVVLPEYWENEILGILEKNLEKVLNG